MISFLGTACCSFESTYCAMQGMILIVGRLVTCLEGSFLPNRKGDEIVKCVLC